MNKKEYARQLKDTGFVLTAKYINAIGKESRFFSIKYGVPQDYEDIFQLALIEAVRLEGVFDAERSNTFLTFIKRPIKQIVQKVYGYSRNTTNKYNKIIKFMKAYEQEHEVLPTVPIIAKALGMTEWLLKSVYYGKPLKVSLESLGVEFSLENEETVLSDSLRDILESLSEDDQMLISYYYLEEYSLDELSAIMSLPNKVITKRLSGIIDNLRETL